MPTLNKYIGAERANRFVASAMKKKFTNMVKDATITTTKVDRPVFVIWCWYKKNKRMDTDNIEFGKKFVLDGLQKSGVIENDGQKQIRGGINFHSVDKDERIELYFVDEQEVIKIISESGSLWQQEQR